MNEAIYIEITATKGSTPRNSGTAMKVTAQSTLGTIGGGALEYQAIAQARKFLSAGTADTCQTIPLGSNLGQCCGGSLTLLFTRQPRPLDTDQFIAIDNTSQGPARPLWVWGAGHVGRAIVRLAAPLGDFDVTWIDTSRGRFPDPMLANVTPLPAADMPRIMPYAPKDALHLIMTYSHDIDLALCAAALHHGFGYCGLIGSATKWARFRKRLKTLNVDPSTIACPIGDPSLGKHPAQIASGTLQSLLAYAAQKEQA